MADRTTYRTWETKRLVEEARYNPNRELAIALGERLEDMDFGVDARLAEAEERARDAERDANKLDDRLYELGVENDRLEMMLDQRGMEIANLQAQIEQLQKGN